MDSTLFAPWYAQTTRILLAGGAHQYHFAERLAMEPEEFSSDSEDAVAVQAPPSVQWPSILQRAVVNLLFPFVNGVMLGFGEIFAHELGLVWGWRSARVYDPSASALATNPRTRRKWLFGLL